MLARCSAFIATSLDGFIARSDGSVDWLDKANQLAPPGEDCGFAAFMATVDGIVMGRKTFELVLTFPTWPYGTTPLYVLSHTLDALPPGAPPTVSLHKGPPQEIAALAWRQGRRSLYVDGGLTIQAFLTAGLLAEITITVIPILLGAGRPLFGALPGGEVWLEHIATHSYPFGFVQSRYGFTRAR